MLIIGNGPSIKGIDLKQYRTELNAELCCVNLFAVKNKDVFFDLKPKYYCMIEPSEMQGIDDALWPATKELVAILEDIDWEMTFITFQNFYLPINNKKIKWAKISRSKYVYNKDQKIAKWLYSKNFASECDGGVVISALHYFITVKYKRIYMVGTDESNLFTMSVDSNNNVLADRNYFYSRYKENLNENGLIAKGQLYAYINANGSRLRQFRNIYLYAEDSKTKLYNLCLNSYIDSIPKIDFSEAIKTKNNTKYL